MATQCHNQLALGFQPKIVLDFNGGQITSDTGLLLLREFDERLGLTKKLPGLFNDWRNPVFIEHQTDEMLCQRIYQIAAGYADCDDADTLRRDPTFQTIVGKAHSLASQPTLSRLENHADGQTIEALGSLALEWFLQHAYPKNHVPKELIIDSDSTDDPCHGQQAFSFFNAAYNQHMYHPLFFFDAQSGCVLTTRLRPGNVHCSQNIPEELDRLVPILKKRFPKTQLRYRADAGSATPKIYTTLESLGLDYVMGIASNPVFKRKAERWLEKAQRKYARSKTPVRRFYSFRHRAKSWRKQRRIVVKIEAQASGTNVRFLITNRAGRAEEIAAWYDQRGECENRIKEFKCDLQAHRLSCHSFGANAFRLKLFTLAYQLLVLFRRQALEKTDLAKARFDTIRLKLFKVGARFKRSARRLWFHLSSSWPGKQFFIEIYDYLRQIPQAASP